RNGARLEKDIVVGTAPRNLGTVFPGTAQMAVPNEINWMGMELQLLTPPIALRKQLPRNQKGLLVMEVGAVSPAGLAGFMPNDIIVSVNRRPVHDALSYSQAMQSADLTQGIMLEVKRNNRTAFITLQ
ncbi:MAG: PDZ domain-containing protein, partial [Nitrospinae bacterium]|nr:PDZ domain-containing protein [Nitrospinota bacterium]